MQIAIRPAFWLGLVLWLTALALWVHPAAAGHGQTLARPLPVLDSTSNPYWSGFINNAAPPYSSVAATWTVPQIRCNAIDPHTAAYIWLGEGGYSRGILSTLIQAGIGATCLNGMAQYQAFYEWYPGIYSTNFPLQVSAGDVIRFVVREARPDYWILSASDLTSGKTAAIDTLFAADTSTAELVVERPTVCGPAGCGQPPLSQFDQVAFTNVRLSNGSGRVTGPEAAAIPIALTNPDTSRLLAAPETSADRKVLFVVFRRAH